MRKWLSGVISYWQTRALDDRLPREVREAARGVLAGDAHGVRVDEPVAVGRIPGGAEAVRRDLEPATLGGRQAVERVGHVDPARDGRVRPALVAGRRAEVDDVLLRDADEPADDVREQARQPRPGREHERVRGEPPARVVDDVQQPVAVRLPGAHGGDPERAAELDEPARGRDAATGRHQQARLGLVDRARDVVRSRSGASGRRPRPATGPRSGCRAPRTSGPWRRRSRGPRP